MEPISYQDALAKGLSIYFTGKPCKYGHVSDRYVKGCRCAECARAESRSRIKEWTAKNPERYAAYQEKYRAENSEKIKAQQKAWREANADELKRLRVEKTKRDPDHHKRAHKRRYENPEHRAKARAAAKQWRKDNPETYHQQMAEYRRNNRDKINATIEEWKRRNPDKVKANSIASSHNYRIRKEAAGKMRGEDVRTVQERKRCEACGRHRGPFEVDHIIALSRGGSHHLSNLQLLCRPCNRSKHNKDQITWAQEQGRLL